MKNLLLGIIAINLTIISINLTLRSIEPAYAQMSRSDMSAVIKQCWNQGYLIKSRNGDDYIIRTKC